MKYFSFLCILMLLSKVILAQNTLIEDSDTLDYLIVQDIDTFHQVRVNYYAPRKKKERNRIVYLNRELLDSSGIHFEGDIQYVNGSFRGYQLDYLNKVYRIFSLDLDKGEANKLLESNSFIPRSFHFGNNKLNQILELAEDGETLLFADLSPYLDYIEPYKANEKIWKVYELSKEKILCESCAWGGGCTLYRYFILKKNSVEEINFDQLRQPYNNQFEPQYEDFRVNLYFSHYDYDFLMAAIDYGTLPDQTDLIFSKDLKDTIYIIKKHQSWEIMGENIQQGKNQRFYLRSKLDNQEKVIVSYKVDKLFEEVAYQVFKGHTISKGQLENFNKDQLAILKNLVFAKHNYAFNSAFYQAYFNLFAFYDDDKKRARRIKNMNGLLSKVDTKNLEVIQQAQKKIE